MVWLDGAQFLDDDFDGFDDVFCFVFEFNEVGSIFSSLFSDLCFLFVEDVQLNLFVFNILSELFNLGTEGLDFLG